MTGPAECPLCARLMCDHTPAERGQTLGAMMGDEEEDEASQAEALRAALAWQLTALARLRLAKFLRWGVRSSAAAISALTAAAAEEPDEAVRLENAKVAMQAGLWSGTALMLAEQLAPEPPSPPGPS